VYGHHEDIDLSQFDQILAGFSEAQERHFATAPLPQLASERSLIAGTEQTLVDESSVSVVSDLEIQ